jgi:hypothetical protein
MVWILKVPLSAPEGESFVSRPSTLDAYVFGFLAPLYKVSFPKVHLQKHLKQLCNLCRFCDDILDSYFRPGPGGESAFHQLMLIQIVSWQCRSRTSLWIVLDPGSWLQDLMVSQSYLPPCCYLHGERGIWLPLSSGLYPLCVSTYKYCPLKWVIFF